MRRAIVAAMLLAIIIYVYSNRKPEPPPFVAPADPVQTQSAEAPAAEPAAPTEQPVVQAPRPRPMRVVKDKSGQKLALRYKIVNGMFIVQGDIVAGAVIAGDNPTEDGLVEMEPLRLWPAVIPYHIQPNVVQKERVLEALKMFEGTAIQFVPENGEKDVLVFEHGEKNCFSYLGKVVEKQQIWISPLCDSADIAHEILHALGFIHEQNRADRDNYVQVYPENIEDEFLFNFDKLPPDYMKVSGTLEFDFKSLMMYPPSMFAKGGRQTMEPRQRDHLIDPSRGLSPGDIQRLNRAYGNRQ